MNKDIVVLSVLGLAGLFCLGSGAYMCIKQLEGWGWFLFASGCIFLFMVLASSDEETPSDGEEASE